MMYSGLNTNYFVWKLDIKISCCSCIFVNSQNIVFSIIIFEFKRFNFFPV